MAPEILCEIPLNDRKSVRLERTIYAGEDLLCLRRYFLSDGGEWLPSKVGINLAVERWRPVAERLTEFFKSESQEETQTGTRCQHAPALP
jgi:hypothetical protein